MSADLSGPALVKHCTVVLSKSIDTIRHQALCVCTYSSEVTSGDIIQVFVCPPGCGGKIAPDGQTECLRHSPCTQGCIFNPPTCLVCRAAAMVIFNQPGHLAASHLHLLQSRWRNLQKLMLHDKKSPWVDPQLPFCLSLVQCTSPTLSLTHLLSDTVWTKRSFEGFPSSSATPSQPPEVGSQPQLPLEHPYPPAQIHQSVDHMEPPRKCRRTGCRRQTSLVRSAIPSSSPP